MIRIVIADDHVLIRDGFAKLIAKENDLALVGEAEDAAGLFEILHCENADIVVLDIGLPDRNGIEVLKDLQTLAHPPRVLILSMHPEGRYAKRAIRNGAGGYITKDRAAEELVSAIRKIHTDGTYITDTLADILAAEIAESRPGRQMGENTPHDRLSDREYQILLLLGDGKSVREAAETLCLSVNTVNSYRARLLEKMRMRTNADLIKYVIRNTLIE
jgi:two-component system, NarL family, invasion response regulator UvrY